MTEGAPAFITELLADHHVLEKFDSGEAETDNWLRSNALRTQRQGSARTRVLVRPGDPRVQGFYAVTPHDTHREDLPGSAAGSLTVVPGYLIAQLAVDRSLQGTGMGGELLLDALETVVRAADTAGGRLVVVDPIHDRALSFYERYGFLRIGATLRLYLKISRVRSSLGPAAARRQRTTESCGSQPSGPAEPAG